METYGWGGGVMHIMLQSSYFRLTSFYSIRNSASPGLKASYMFLSARYAI